MAVNQEDVIRLQIVVNYAYVQACNLVELQDSTYLTFHLQLLGHK